MPRVFTLDGRHCGDNGFPPQVTLPAALSVRQIREAILPPWDGPGNACIGLEDPFAAGTDQHHPVHRRKCVQVDSAVSFGDIPRDGFDVKQARRSSNAQDGHGVTPQPTFVDLLLLPADGPVQAQGPFFGLTIIRRTALSQFARSRANRSVLQVLAYDLRSIGLRKCMLPCPFRKPRVRSHAYTSPPLLHRRQHRLEVIAGE